MGEMGAAAGMAHLPAGRMVGHYRIESWIGEGAMGVVYRARDTRLGRTVAIKVLRPESVAHPERRKRFVQEARAASALNHPNIITIYDIHSEDGLDFIAMEFVDGKTLSNMIGRKGLGWQETLKYTTQMADALATAHTGGLVHRDLKPANVMVTAQGLVKVLDFGLAKLLEPAAAEAPTVDQLSPTDTGLGVEGPRTEEGTIVGTVSYMSPEQAEGRPLDARSDIFSFGSVLYEMLTGRWAFQGATRLAILSAILREDPPPLSAGALEAPPELDRILARCLRKDPDRRFQHMADVKVALQELKEESESDRLAIRRGAATRPQRRRRWMVAAAGALLIVVLAVVAWLVRPQWFLSPGVPAEKRLAVLYFENVGRDPANQPFCDGLAESLASSLTQLEQFHRSLQVVPISEVRREGAASAREARQSFGVSLVVTGSVQRAGNEVRLTANLVDARTLRQLRSFTDRTAAEELSSLQDRVVRGVAAMLELELGPQARQALSAGGTTVPGAYEFYLQGRGYLQRHDRPENLESAVALFGQALQKDPSYALAYAGLGETYWHKHRLTREPQWVEQARRNCDQAVKIDARLAPVRVTLGMIYRGTGKYPEAVEELQAALQLDPVNADAWRELAAPTRPWGAWRRPNRPCRRPSSCGPAIGPLTASWAASTTAAPAMPRPRGSSGRSST